MAEKTNDIVGRALFQYRTGVNNYCGFYDPTGECIIMDCLVCENCFYKITLENGEAISNTIIDFEKLKKARIGLGKTKEILFYDYVPEINNLFNYLVDNNSHYTFKEVNEEDMIEHYSEKTKKLIKINSIVEKQKNETKKN